MSIPGIVLAAGASSRMGRPKALIAQGGSTFVGVVTSVLQAAGARPLLVVTREELAERVRAAIPASAGLVVNVHPERGMLTSILVGLEAVTRGRIQGTDRLSDLDVRAGGGPPSPFPYRGFLLALVDQPQVSEPAVRALLQAFEGSPDRIVVPWRGDRRGHPIVIPADLVGELWSASPEEGARVVVRANAHRILKVELQEDGPFLDFDTPQDLERGAPPQG